MITIKNDEQIEKMRAAGALLHSTLTRLRALAKPGVSTAYLDKCAEEMIRDGGGKPSFKGYGGFPYSICASVDEEVVHGYASDQSLRPGQLLSIDCGVELDGWNSDSAFSLVIGDCNKKAQKLIDITEKCFWLGAAQARAGNRIGDIAQAVQTYAEGHGCGVVRDLTGHGIGRKLHEDPAVPNFGRAGRGPRLEKGMTICVEPMITAGTWKCWIKPNQWTYYTRDRSLAAHYEHTLLITDGAPELLSWPGKRFEGGVV